MDLTGALVIVFMVFFSFALYKVVLGNPNLTDWQRMWALLFILCGFVLFIIVILILLDHFDLLKC